jgi:hypothetical protein
VIPPLSQREKDLLLLCDLQDSYKMDINDFGDLQREDSKIRKVIESIIENKNPTKQLTFRHDTVKVVIFSEIDTVLILRIARKNRGHSDKVINLVQGLNALCLCPTFPYSYHDRGLTRDKVKNRPDSGTTMSIIVGAIPQTTFIASHMPVDPKHREADTFAKLFLTRHTDDGLVEKILLSIHDKNFDHDLQYLAMREVALSGLECSAFIEKNERQGKCQLPERVQKVLMD